MAFGQQPFKRAIAMQNKISEIIAKGKREKQRRVQGGFYGTAC